MTKYSCHGHRNNSSEKGKCSLGARTDILLATDAQTE